MVIGFPIRGIIIGVATMRAVVIATVSDRDAEIADMDADSFPGAGGQRRKRHVGQARDGERNLDEIASILMLKARAVDWKLSVADNGVGRAEAGGPPPKGGLGSSLVAALAHQLDAKVAVLNSPTGMNIPVTRATFVSRSAA
jgi:two-component sensor histidine kinase